MAWPLEMDFGSRISNLVRGEDSNQQWSLDLNISPPALLQLQPSSVSLSYFKYLTHILNIDFYFSISTGFSVSILTLTAPMVDTKPLRSTNFYSC